MELWSNGISELPTKASEFRDKTESDRVKKANEKKAEKDKKNRISEINGSDA